MSLCVNSFRVADVTPQQVTLQPMLGAYELGFGLKISIEQAGTYARRVSLRNARVTIKCDDSEPKVIGWAWPESPFSIHQTSSPSSQTRQFLLTLQPGQLNGIEELRGAGDLTFELHANGLGYDQNGEAPVQDTWRFSVSRSDWIKQLQRANARDILLLEVPLPLPEDTGERAKIGHLLKSAEEQFRAGDYIDTVAHIRKFVEALGKWRFGQEPWANKHLARLANKDEREAMSKDEREMVLWAAVRNYAHLAHHTTEDGSVQTYSRADAELILTSAVALFASSQRH